MSGELARVEEAAAEKEETKLPPAPWPGGWDQCQHRPMGKGVGG